MSPNTRQFKITLKHTKPPIWRRILVPGDLTFWDLHVAIQDAMGWCDCHLHQFEVFDPRKRRVVLIGMPDDETPMGEQTLPGWKVPVARLLTMNHPRALYTYDFGDGWDHDVVLEKVLPQDPSQKLPQCVGGRRRCPPEDCGGPWGYRELLAAMADPNHEEHEALLEWLGGDFDPDDFSPAEVEFDDPRERLQHLLEDMY